MPPVLLGNSAAILRATSLLAGLTSERAALLVADEGLEAESVARHVHAAARAGQPFVSVDCAVGDAEAVERALLGSRGGSAARSLEVLGPGAALVAARAGTVYLANLGDLPAAAQRRLARVLRDGEARVGSRDAVRLGACVIASASPALASDARDGRFRADLLRRFARATVTIPSLAARPEDLPPIVARISREMCESAGRPVASFTQAALTVLAALPWPRNVEELRSALGRVLRHATGPTIQQEDVLRMAPVDDMAAGLVPLVSLREARRRFEREYIAEVLERHRWRMSDAARTLGMERANLYRKTRQLGIVRAPARRTR